MAKKAEKIAKKANSKAAPKSAAKAAPAKAKKEKAPVPKAKEEVLAKPSKIALVKSPVSEPILEAVEPEVLQPAKAPKQKAASGKSSKTKKQNLEIAKAAESNKKWSELKNKYSADKAPVYSMTGSYEANTPLNHKKFGWGYVISSENNRLDVLFEDGSRQLISNYKP